MFCLRNLVVSSEQQRANSVIESCSGCGTLLPSRFKPCSGSVDLERFRDSIESGSCFQAALCSRHLSTRASARDASTSRRFMKYSISNTSIQDSCCFYALSHVARLYGYPIPPESTALDRNG